VILSLSLQKAQKYAKALEKRRAEFTTAEQSINVTDDQEMEVNRQLKELTEETTTSANDKMQLENDLKAAMAPVKSKERERGLLSRELAQEKKKHVSAVRRLEQARRQILESQGNVAEEERVRTRRIAQTENDLARARDQVEPLKEEVTKHLRNYQDIEPAVQQAKETMDGTERQLAGVQQKMNAMQQESRDGMAALVVFGSKCKALYEVRDIIVIGNARYRLHYDGILTCNMLRFTCHFLHTGCPKGRKGKKVPRPRRRSRWNVCQDRQWQGELCQNCRIGHRSWCPR
jgi:chromosome segregation ATPase